MTSTNTGFSIDLGPSNPADLPGFAVFLLNEMDKRIVTIGFSGFPVRLLEPDVYRDLLEHIIFLMQERIAHPDPRPDSEGKVPK
jgi:hypothetical protein|tara:strand:+ start:963 stop:1214 length:252 start_codon:yes stop_codon:yes gene_type:complete